eukprot:GEMP01032561.1.p1 GENE.GEMP01032561.1~~GEMP01032561.1.p1  ORF type:complete len:595 (+),score=134.51 GEMP01032561.1:153-1937(+)
MACGVGSHDSGLLPRTPPRGHNGVALPAMQHPVPPLEAAVPSRTLSSREHTALRRSPRDPAVALRPLSRELPLRSPSLELPHRSPPTSDATSDIYVGFPVPPPRSFTSLNAGAGSGCGSTAPRAYAAGGGSGSRDNIMTPLRGEFTGELPLKVPRAHLGCRRKSAEERHGEYRPKSGRKESKNSLRGSSNKDSDIVSAMAQRLSRVERSLTQKNLEVEALRCELDICRRALARYEGSVETLSVVQENADLRAQVSEMTQFLADYGLTWVGESGTDSAPSPLAKPRNSHFAGNDIARPSHASQFAAARASAHDMNAAKWTRSADVDIATDNTPAHVNSVDSTAGGGRDSGGSGFAGVTKSVDINYIEARVEALNAIAEKDSKIVKLNGFARFDMDRRVTINFYKDGLRVADLPFFRYESEQGSRILQDILDGYFPYCLKKQYPGGVPLVVKDLTALPFTDFKDMQRAFMDRLPSKVITEDGTVCDVRSQIQRRLGTEMPSAGWVSNGGKQEVIDLRPDGWDNDTNAKLCKIQVRDGSHSWLFHVSSLQTIEEIIARVPVQGTFNLRSACPQKLYNGAETLETAGLVPNASLFVHR